MQSLNIHTRCKQVILYLVQQISPNMSQMFSSHIGRYFVFCNWGTMQGERYEGAF